MAEVTATFDDITSTCTVQEVAEVIRKKQAKKFKLIGASWSDQKQAWKLLWDPNSLPPKPAGTT